MAECCVCLESIQVNGIACCGSCEKQIEGANLCKICANEGEMDWGFCNLCQRTTCNNCIRICDVCEERSLCVSCVISDRCCNCEGFLATACAGCEVYNDTCPTCSQFMCESCSSLEQCTDCASSIPPNSISNFL